MKITKEVKTSYTITLPNEKMSAVKISETILNLAQYVELSEEATVVVINNPVSSSYGGSIVVTDTKTRYYDDSTLERING